MNYLHSIIKNNYHHFFFLFFIGVVGGDFFLFAFPPFALLTP